jgi:hypothetical protein
MLESPTLAQTINFTAIPPILASNLFVGSGFTGSYTNLQVKATLGSTALDPANLVTYTASGAPSGATITFSGTGTTNSVTNTLSVAVANVAKGVYPITITATTNGVQFGNAPSNSASFNLVVGNLWTNLNTTAVNWNAPANWSTGLPVSSDDVLFQDAGGNTNYVDSSTTIGSLTYIRSLSGTNFFTTIASGATLSIVGPRGFSMNEDTTTAGVNSKTMTVTIAGQGGSLVVSNQSANYAINAANTGSSGTTVVMTNLDKQTVEVNRVGLGDSTLADRGGVMAQLVNISLAKTNFFTAGYSNDYSGLDFAASIQCFNNPDNGNSAYNNGSGNTLNLGITNVFLADSFRAGASREGSGNNVVRFNPVFTNGLIPVAYFRNTNGGRMTLFALGVDSGVAATGSNAKCLGLFQGGILDLMVDTIWLGRNRTNGLSGAAGIGNLNFGGTTSGTSKVDVNTLYAGFQAYSNNAIAQATITVQTNAILTVNNNLILGYVSGDTNFAAPGITAAQSFGQVVVNGGIVRVKQITTGQGSTNNQITLNVGSTMVVSNTVASPANNLTTMTFNGGSLTLFVAAGSTNAYVTNLNTTVNGGKINIASVSGFASFPATNVLIAYQTAASHSFAIGTLPPGFNNMQIVDDTVSKTISLVISTNQPKTLAWRGGQDSNWNHSSLNWLDLNLLTITKFTDGDSVVFDDAAAVPTNITITDTILPGQTGTGILVTNNVNSFIFNNSGGGTIGGASLIKTGATNLQVDAITAVAVQVQQGQLTGGGTIASANVLTNASIDFSGIISGAFVCAGTGTLESGSTVNGPMAIQSGAVVTNSGTVQGGALTMQSGTFLYNLGTLGNIGAATVATNSTIINANTIGTDGLAGNSLTVDGTFEDLGTGTTIYLDSLTLEGNSSTFIPGGDGIGTTKFSFNHQTTGHTLIRLLAGSKTIIKVNLANVQPYTTIDAERFVFGPNHSDKRVDGCTLVITNLGAPYAAPQDLALFVNSYSGPAIGDAGLNTTNSYPVIVPASPGTGFAWDILSDLRPDGVVKIVGIATNPANITSAFTVSSSNIVTEISWPSDHIGWSLQQLTTTTATGLAATNWVTIFGSTLTNDVVITNGTITSDAAIFYRLSNQ